MTTAPQQSVLILGAGLAGLAAAYHLSRSDHRVTVLDHSGWRDGFRINAPDAAPILLGCHAETGRLLRDLDGHGSSQSDTTIPLEFRLPDGRLVAYRSARLPGALQWMMSLFSFDGLPWQDRWTLFSHLEEIWEDAQTLPADLDNRTADEWLASTGQSRKARDCIWTPLARWLTGNALVRLSAATFVHLLSTVFLGRAMDARTTHLNGSIGDRFLAPLRTRLDHVGVRTQSLSDVPILRFEENTVSGVLARDGTIQQADWYIAAIPPHKLLTLVPERLQTRYAYFAHLGELATLSDIAIQFTCRSTSRTPRLLLLAERPFHSCVVTPLGPPEIRCRLSATGEQALAELRDDQLMELGRAELEILRGEILPEGIQAAEVMRDDQAALSLHPGAALLRPIQQSPIRNLLVAGPWTDTGWPATVESALVSAARCAALIAGSRK